MVMEKEARNLKTEKGIIAIKCQNFKYLGTTIYPTGYQQENRTRQECNWQTQLSIMKQQSYKTNKQTHIKDK